MGAITPPSTVLITGGTDGLGRAAAILLAERGYRVFAAGRSSQRRAQLDALARERGLPLQTVGMDVCDGASVERALAEVRARGGPIEALISNAGVGYVAVMEEIRMQDLRQQFEVNFFGTVRVTQRVLPEMRERRHGRIVIMSSVAGKLAIPLFGPYSGTKFALEGMADALRLEVYPFGIDVVLIEPGYIPTNFQNTSLELSEAYRVAANNSPYRRIYQGFAQRWKKSTQGVRYTPEDCARVILRALRASQPKPRYPVTRNAWVVSLAKRLLPDRILDWRLRRAFRLERTPGASPPRESPAKEVPTQDPPG